MMLVNKLELELQNTIEQVVLYIETIIKILHIAYDTDLRSRRNRISK